MTKSAGRTVQNWEKRGFFFFFFWSVVVLFLEMTGD